VSIQFRSIRVRRLLRRFTQPVGDGPLDWWSAKPSEIEGAVVGPRSVMFRHERCDYRFAVLSRRQTSAIVRELDRLKIKYTVVKHTTPAIFGMTNNRKSPWRRVPGYESLLRVLMTPSTRRSGTPP
jgi:hypothetical protein